MSSTRDNATPGTEVHAIQSAVFGRVTVEGTNQGVPGLLVEAISPGPGGAVRLGAVPTDAEGGFAIEGVATSLVRDGTSWDLQVRVLAPERPGLARERRTLFTSDVRQRAGHREHFPIEVPKDVLTAANLVLPEVATSHPDAVIQAAGEVRTIDVKAQAVRDAEIAARLESVAKRRDTFRGPLLDRFKAELSTVSEAEKASDRYVPAPEEIQPVYLSALVTDVGRLLETRPGEAGEAGTARKVQLKGRLTLTEAQREALSSALGSAATLSEKDVEQVLSTSLDKPAVVYARHLEPDPCRPRTDAEDCLDGPLPPDGTEGEAPGEDGETTGSGSAHTTGAFDRAAAIATLMGRQVSPEDPVEFGDVATPLEASLTVGGVSDAIHQVIFSPGPAEVPAFHDFHDLQVAFEPVWQEALDDRLLGDVGDLYDRVVEQGGRVADAVFTNFVTAVPSRGFLHGLFDNLLDIATATQDPSVPAAVVSAVYISQEEWQALPAGSQTLLLSLAQQIEQLRSRLISAIDPQKIPDSFLQSLKDLMLAAYTKEALAYRAQIQVLRADAERLVAHARRLLLEREARQPFRPTHAVIEDLRRRRSQAYPFRYFAASPTQRSVNFGIVVTYRQKWTPVSYQVGELVKTIPLAPREVRKFTRRTVTKTRRARQEIESNLVARKRESEQKTRAEAEIVARATARTSFSLSHSGTVNLGEEGVGGSATTTTSFTRDAEKHSESIKREFREAILKSAEEYKNERKVEVTTEETFESETTESGEIQNPNDEIPVTFLFYELQRRYQVGEKIHRLQSVVLVAQEVPAPSELDAAWLIRHDWILNRVLLDDSFRPALTYASTTLVSEDAALREMREALFRQRKLVEELKEDVSERRALEGLRYAALQRQIERTAASADSGGGLFGAVGDLVGNIPIAGEIIEGGIDLLTGGGGVPSEAAQVREGAARDAYDRERREGQELFGRLENALSALEQMESDYSERLAQHLRQLAQVERLIGHIVQNIMPYMQAIWAYEPDDQRFLRLRNVPVPTFQKDKAQRHYAIAAQPSPVLMARHIPGLRDVVVNTDLSVIAPPRQPAEIATRPLSEVADLNRPLGFLGNYMIFPMYEPNAITEFMMDPYVTLAEGEYGVSDPDPLGNMSLEEFSDYVCCLREHFDQNGGSGGEAEGQDEFDRMKPFLRETLKRLLERSLRDNDEVIVPTDSLYIEALPGAHSIMERFKHLHRQVDVKAAQEDVRRAALDNVRRAQRIVAGDLEDPDIEAKYLFAGDGQATVVPPPPPSGGGNP